VKAKSPGLCLLIGAVLLSTTLGGCLGCGGENTIRMDLTTNADHPVSLGIYLLSKESALDGKPNADLTNREVARTFTAADGVVDYDVRAIYPDKPFSPFIRTKPDPAITHVLIVANIAKPDPCTRRKFAVEPGKDLELRIAVADNCLKVLESDD